MEEANKTKEFLNSIQTKDVLHEEKKKAIAEKYLKDIFAHLKNI